MKPDSLYVGLHIKNYICFVREMKEAGGSNVHNVRPLVGRMLLHFTMLFINNLSYQ